MVDSDCSDGLFCDGIEVCAPASASADAHGCVAASAPACAAPMTCSEAAHTCLVPCGADPDADGDGHIALACGGDDCDDTDANRYPGDPEVCDAAGHDEDCNLATLGPDADGDGFEATTCCDLQPSGTRLCGTDCDDTRATVNPSALESCNAMDDNCNGMIDEGVLATFYADCDGDGFGVATSTVMACVAPSTPPSACGATGHWASMAGDCDDAQAGRSPAAPEVCDSIVDNDCNPATHPFDADLDGHDLASCGGDDCNDADSAVHPGAPELCDRTDNACAFGGGAAVSEDFDADGFAPLGAACTGGPLPKLDCNDVRADVHPGAIEICNGVDDDCNGTTDENPAAMTSCNHTGTIGSCVLGGCTIAMCTGSFRNCDGVATNGCEADLDADTANCTACGTRCATGALCASGGCSCPSTIPTLCPGACVDTTTDGTNCGACGNRCPSGATCSASTCRCPFGWILCGSACIDPMSDVANCGGCGQACTGGSCAGGACTCPGAMGTLCSGVCHDLSVDLANCGACGAGCLGGSCAGGGCTCPPTAPTICSGACTDTVTSGTHCGTCTRACGGGGTCGASTCDGVTDIFSEVGAYWHPDRPYVAIRAGGGTATWAGPAAPTFAATTFGETGVREVAGPTILYTDGTLRIPGVGDITGVVDVAYDGGSEHGCFVLSTGVVRCWGTNTSGQLGDGTRVDRPAPVTALGISSAIAVGTGDASSCAVLSGGAVACWGGNSFLQTLPTSASTYITTPTVVAGVSGATSLALGHSSSFALRSDGTVLCWGANDVPGPGCGTGVSTPALVPGLVGVAAITATYAHACAWEASGRAWCWGSNNYDETLGAPGPFQPTPLLVPGFSAVRSVAAAANATCVLSTDDTVYCWGNTIGPVPVQVTNLTPSG